MEKKYNKKVMMAKNPIHSDKRGPKHFTNVEPVNQTKCSFIIITVANRKNIFEIINTLKNAGLKNFEIIVVVQISVKNEPAIMTELGGLSNILIIRNSGIDSVPMKRNLGFNASSGDVLCFIDDDVTLDISLINFLENITTCDNNIYLPEIRNSAYVPFPLGDHVGGKSYVSACFIMDRDDYKKLGGMNERFLTYRDDSEFFIRAVRNGLRVNFIPDTFIWHPIRYTNFKTIRSFFIKNELEPLFHKLTKGNYYGLLGDRKISLTPNRYGFSVLTYFLIVASVLSIALLFLTSTLLIILISIYFLFSLIISSFYMLYPNWFLNGNNKRRLASISIYMILFVILIPSRLIGSVKYKHFTL